MSAPRALALACRSRARASFFSTAPTVGLACTEAMISRSVMAGYVAGLAPPRHRPDGLSAELRRDDAPSPFDAQHPVAWRPRQGRGNVCRGGDVLVVDL